MTNQPPTTGALDAALRNVRDTFTEIGFQLAAQGALAELLRGIPNDQAHTRLTRLTTDQVERIDRASRTLTQITDGILEDRAIAESEQDTQTPEPSTGHPEGSARLVDGGS